MEPVTLRTERLVLSMPDEADIDEITAAAQDPQVIRWTTLPSPYERVHAEQFVEKVPQLWAAGTDFVWAIRGDGRFAGMIGLHHVERDGAGEIGYWIAAPARGQGYVKEAARAVVDFGFSSGGAGLVRIEWRAVVGNIPSARTARSLGFRYEGLIRQGLSSPRGRDDGWTAGLLVDDDRMPQPWSVLRD